MRTRRYHHYTSTGVSYRNLISSELHKNLKPWARHLRCNLKRYNRFRGRRGSPDIEAEIGMTWLVGSNLLTLEVRVTIDYRHKLESYDLYLFFRDKLSEEMDEKARTIAGILIAEHGYGKGGFYHSSDGFCLGKRFTRPLNAECLSLDWLQKRPLGPEYFGSVIVSAVEVLKPVVERLMDEFGD